MVSFTKLATVLATAIAAVNGFIPVTGVTDSGVNPRLEIRTLQSTQAMQFNLYIQALNVMYTLDINNGTSYFQIMGIHGAPNVPWDGVQSTTGGFGYCPHSINIFPTWHRPYIALYEQQLINSARAVALFYPQAIRSRWIQAANQLRAPYFDWAIAPANGKNAIPDVFSQQALTINTPGGMRTTVNPLYAYRFQRQVTDIGDPFSYWPLTLRWPTSNAQNAQSNNGAVINTFNQNRDGLRAGLFQWFVNCQSYLEMSDDNAQNTSPGCSTSLESIHNNVHLYFGGTGGDLYGHMTAVPVSAFDPAFMLHHANIDRLFALWQVVYPGSYDIGQVSNQQTFMINRGDYLDGNSPLWPFRAANGQPWTSNGIRNPAVLGYTYPEIIQSGGNSNNMKSIINNLYSSQAGAHANKKRRGPARRDVLPSIVPDVLKATNGSTFQYNANVQTSKYKLGGTFNVFFFFGEPTTTDSSKYAFDPNTVGSYGVLAASQMKDSDIVSASTVSLSKALLDRVNAKQLGNLTPLTVGLYLKQNLIWKVIGPDGKEIDPTSIPDFKVTVVQSTLTPIVDLSEFPVFSKYYPVTMATSGKAGGYTSGPIDFNSN